MTNIIFTNPEYRRMAFKRKGHRTVYCASDLQVRKTIIKEYNELPFDPDSLVTPSSILNPQPIPASTPSTSAKPGLLPPPLTLHDVARSVLRNQFIDFGDPDHLALIRLSGSAIMRLLAALAEDHYHTELRPPNMVINTRNATCIPAMKLQDQLDFLNQHIPLTGLTRPPLRTYEEIVTLAETPYPTGTKIFYPPTFSLDLSN